MEVDYKYALLTNNLVDNYKKLQYYVVRKKII